MYSTIHKDKLEENIITYNYKLYVILIRQYCTIINLQLCFITW